MGSMRNKPGCGCCGGGTTGPDIPGCSCTITPATVAMTSHAPSCASGMFQSCTLTYVPTPACYAALGLGSNIFLSTASFLDAGGQSFQYYLNCQFTQYTLSRVYCSSTYGSPYLDIVRYSWRLTDPGNTCTPWAMGNGVIFFGGDTACNVTLAPG